MLSRMYAGWVAVGIVIGLAFLVWPALGLVVALLVVAVAILVAPRARSRLDGLGLVVGFGIPFLVVAFVNRDAHPCGEVSFGSCSGLDPRPWLVIGLVATAAGLGAYAALRVIGRLYPCHRSAK